MPKSRSAAVVSQKVHFGRTLWQAAMRDLSMLVYDVWCSPMASGNAPGDSSIIRINALFLAVFLVNTIGLCTMYHRRHRLVPLEVWPWFWRVDLL